MCCKSPCLYPLKNKDISNESKSSPHYSAHRGWWKPFKFTEKVIFNYYADCTPKVMKEGEKKSKIEFIEMESLWICTHGNCIWT